jgi:MFS family permease
VDKANATSAQAGLKTSWISRTVVGIILATFFSDVSHEMATAVLPLYLAAVGLGPAALGLIEGLADFLVSISKLAGGVVGHHVHYKRPWASLGYLITTVATAAMGLVVGLASLVSLRTAAWFGRGFRSPLRDFMLADAVEKTHFGRAYGLERAGDMLGAVVGPLIATLLVWLGLGFPTIILWTLVPGLIAASAMFFLTQERDEGDANATDDPPAFVRPPFPRAFWVLLVGITLFGLGDFSRTFIIWLAARGLGEDGTQASGLVSIAVLLYALHNLVSAGAAVESGKLGDRWAKLPVLVVGYAIGVGTNLLLAFTSGSLAWLVTAILLSGIYIAIEETLEKAVAAELLPRELRSLGFGILACANAVGDMVSSLYVGLLLQAGQTELAFGIAATCGALGVLWMICLLLRAKRAVR